METNNKFKEINISQLKLYDRNLRNPKSIRDQRHSEIELIEHMFLDASLTEFMLAIGGKWLFTRRAAFSCIVPF